MSKILVTHPGRIGDCLWAAATMRLIAERAGEPVTLLIPPGLAGVGELLKLQSYIEDVVVDKWWEVQDTAPISPRLPPNARIYELHAQGIEIDKMIHLGYQSWPKSQLAREAYFIASVEGELNPLDLSRPWITPPTPEAAGELAEIDIDPEDGYGEVSVGFTDEWGELKAGILLAVADKIMAPEEEDYIDYEVLAAPGTRWDKEFLTPLCELDNIHSQVGDWVKTAYIISRTKVFLGCLSSQAVLAMALGKPRVLVEPNFQRHHEIFQHPDQPLVLGNDGKPTFHAPHVADALREKLQQKS